MVNGVAIVSLAPPGYASGCYKKNHDETLVYLCQKSKYYILGTIRIIIIMICRYLTEKIIIRYACMQHI